MEGYNWRPEVGLALSPKINGQKFVSSPDLQTKCECVYGTSDRQLALNCKKRRQDFGMDGLGKRKGRQNEFVLIRPNWRSGVCDVSFTPSSIGLPCVTCSAGARWACDRSVLPPPRLSFVWLRRIYHRKDSEAALPIMSLGTLWRSC